MSLEIRFYRFDEILTLVVPYDAQVTESVTALLEGLEALYLCGRVVELVIMLGSTPINPKVRHCLKSSLKL
jgi:hypothetical protein